MLCWRKCISHNLAIAAAVLLCAAEAFPQARIRPAQDVDQPNVVEERDQPLGRAKWFLRGRIAPPGESSAALRLRAYRQMREMQARQGVSNANRAAFGGPFPLAMGSGPAWQPLGPAPIISDPSGFQDYGNVTGRVTAIAIDQADTSGNTIYVAGAYGGVWKSTNATAPSPTFVPLTEFEGTLSIGALSISPVNRNIILAGTGEPNNAIDSYYGLGILRSVNGGASWSLIESANGGTRPFHGLGFNKFAWNGNTSVAATGGTIAPLIGGQPGTAIQGLYVSSDAGATWQMAQMDSTVSGAASATDVVFNATAGLFFAAIRRHGFYQSSDGISWTRLAIQPGLANDLLAANCGATPNSNCHIFRGQLAVRPGSNEMYAWYIDEPASGEVDKGIWQSTNGGTSWATLTNTGRTACAGSGGDPSTSCGTGGQGFFDLYLAVVPSGDVYAGAVNLFKLQAGGNSWLNLTQVYGCNTSHVHPDQHAIAFLIANPSIISFGNDGGLYRSLTATALTNNGCVANPFDNLNTPSLGSFSEYVSFSQHPTNPGIILGGLQDNGSPAITDAGSGNLTWSAVNLGDGGYNAIDAQNPFNLFTAINDANIFQCTASPSDPTCIFLFFNPLVNVDAFGGSFPQNFPDHGDFYTPYILDPANQTRVIIGTCRVWRGSANDRNNWIPGSFANAVSNNLATGTGGVCTGGENSLVRSLAAGGPPGPTGSAVIYAGTIDGHVFVTTNAGSGVANWNSSLFNGFPISSIAIDKTDLTGQTAYITNMGFTGGGNHVFKTTNAGLSWFDPGSFNGLPDAPADAIVIDPGNHNTLYVGTDVGVFVSFDAGGSWEGFGTGFPNVAVTAMRAFSSGGVNKLRVSTYGRGVWQTDLAVRDFAMGSVSGVITTFPTVANSGSVTFQASGLGFFKSNVSFSCSGLPAGAGCNISPNPANPLPSAPVTVSVNVTTSSALAGSYSISITGTSSGLAPKTISFTLVVQDYTLSASPALVTVFPNQTGVFPTSATALQGYSNSVSLTCPNQPAGVGACTFTPGPSVTPGGLTNTNVSTVAGTTTPKDYSITIRGTGTDAGSTVRNAPVVLRVVDFA